MKPFKVWFTDLQSREQTGSTRIQIKISPKGGETLPSEFHLICWTRCAGYKSLHIPAVKQLERARNCGLWPASCSVCWSSFSHFHCILALQLSGSATSKEKLLSFSESCTKSYPTPKETRKKPKQMHANLVSRNREGWEQRACRFLL